MGASAGEITVSAHSNLFATAAVAITLHPTVPTIITTITITISIAHPNSTGTDAPELGTLPQLTLCLSSPGRSSRFLTASFNKLVNVKYFPEFWEPF